MAGTKRPFSAADGNGHKRVKQEKPSYKSGPKPSSKPTPEQSLDAKYAGLSDASEDETEGNGANGASARPSAPKSGEENYLKATGSTSREAHAKQKALVQERKAAKPNADVIARSKQLWERLRIKSAVPPAERKELVTELFSILTGRVHDFVFKHDSVRVIQTGLKYGNLEQRKQIAKELKGEYKNLAESRYAKFLVAKLMVHGDAEIREIIVPEFYGNVKRMIRHPEASWILDDIYRTVATKEQKAIMLREWYGPEFVVFKSEEKTTPTTELSEILKANPEKRGPIMQHLHELTNQLVQKKTTGFTMLHDAMLQYFLNTKPGSSEFNEAIQVLLDDEEGDCLKNLAFTRSGARLVCLTLAHASAKDRKLILRHYKGTMKMLAGDQYGHMIILTAFEVIDDTVMTAKSIFPELLNKDMDDESRQQELLVQCTDLTARIPILYLFNPSTSTPKWLFTAHPADTEILSEVHTIRQTASKKEPETRRRELLKPLTQPLLDLITAQAPTLLESTPGSQFISEVLLATPSLTTDSSEINNTPAQQALVDLSTSSDSLSTPQAGRLLKTLVASGKFSPETKSLTITSPALQFADLLYTSLTSSSPKSLLECSTSGNSFVIVAMVERGDTFTHQSALQEILKGKDGKKKIKDAASGKGQEGGKENAGAKILVKLLGL